MSPYAVAAAVHTQVCRGGNGSAEPEQNVQGIQSDVDDWDAVAREKGGG